MSEPAQGVNALFLTTTPIRTPGDLQATGFFVVYQEEPFLVTNRHVVDAKTANDEPLHSVRITIRPDPDDVTETEFIDIELHDDDGSPHWFGLTESVDLAVVPLKPPVTTTPIELVTIHQESDFESGSIGFHATEPYSNRWEGIEQIPAGLRAIILSHPITGNVHDFPIAYDTVISSPYGYDFDGKCAFATDSNTKKGASGSPIIAMNRRDYRIFGPEKPTTSAAMKLLETMEWHMLGIHSARADINSRLDLGVGWYSETLYDIFDSI